MQDKLRKMKNGAANFLKKQQQEEAANKRNKNFGGFADKIKDVTGEPAGEKKVDHTDDEKPEFKDILKDLLKEVKTLH